MNLRPVFFLIPALIFSSCGDSDSEAEKSLPTLSINDAAGQEGGPAVFTVSLSTASTEKVSFTFTTVHETTSSADIVEVTTPQTIEINPGATSAELILDLKADSETEQSETFQVVLASPTNATLSDDNKGTGTVNNVAAPYFLKVKIDGQQWSATMMSDFFAPSFIGNSFAGYGAGSFNDSQLSFVFFEEPTGPKTYQIVVGGATNSNEVSVYYSPTFFSESGFGPIFNAQPGGEVVLTKYDVANAEAEGTFNFTAESDEDQTLTFTEGQFRIPIE